MISLEDKLHLINKHEAGIIKAKIETAAASYPGELQQIIEEGNYTNDQILNC
jgi:hypothetical protein